MASSQFTIYSSADTGLFITGTTGSLVSVLDACLVNGLGSKPGAGWIKPSGSISGSLTAYTQPAGCGFTLLVNDASPYVTAGAKEAWVVGWENLSALTSSNTTPFSSSVGSGMRQFPAPGQGATTSNTFGKLAARKSGTADNALRNWICLADSSSFYLFIQSGDTAGLYTMLAFGDIYSFAGSSDVGRCLIIAKTTEGGGAGTGESSDQIYCANPSFLTGIHYMARTYSGIGGSIPVVKIGDFGKATSNTGGNTPLTAMAGVVPAPNPVDLSYYLSPIWISECALAGAATNNAVIRGRVRGMFHLCHPISNFSDGQIINGTGDYAGKTFLVIKSGYNSGMWAMEISNTVETN